MLDTRSQFWEALADWRTALAAFNDADAECLDYAIYQLQAAKAKLALALHSARSAAPVSEAPGRPQDRLRMPSHGLKEPRA